MSHALLTFIQEGRSGTGAGVRIQPLNSILSEWRLFIDTIGGGSAIVAAAVLTGSLASLYFFRKGLNGPLKKITVLMLVQIVVFIAGLSFFFEDIWSHYLVGLPVLYIGLVSISWYMWYTARKSQRMAAVVVLTVLILINLNLPSRIQSFVSQPILDDPAQYTVQKRVIDYIYEDAEGMPFKYAVYTPPVHDYTYSYLFSWYGKKIYGYTPVENADLFYLIIEPDNAYPDRIDHWLEVRKGDGTVVHEEIMPGSIRIQKRIYAAS